MFFAKNIGRYFLVLIGFDISPTILFAGFVGFRSLRIANRATIKMMRLVASIAKSFRGLMLVTDILLSEVERSLLTLTCREKYG